MVFPLEIRFIQEHPSSRHEYHKTKTEDLCLFFLFSYKCFRARKMTQWTQCFSSLYDSIHVSWRFIMSNYNKRRLHFCQFWKALKFFCLHGIIFVLYFLLKSRKHDYWKRNQVFNIKYLNAFLQFPEKLLRLTENY